MNIVKTIVGGPEYGDSHNQRKKYLMVVSHGMIAQSINLTYVQRPSIPFESIYFTVLEAKRILHPHNDAIILTMTVTNSII